MNIPKIFKNKSFLVTGGAGFIGSNLTEKLVSLGGNVTVLDNFLKPYGSNIFNLNNIIKKIKIIKGDVGSKQFMEKMAMQYDYIYHLAGQTGRVISNTNPELDMKINLVGTLNILEYARKSKKPPKVIFTSSRGVYGRPFQLPVDEETGINPLDIYGVNKFAAESYCRILGREWNIPVTVLRLNNIYGPKCQVRHNHYGTINLFIAYALSQKTIPIYGDGRQSRDYVYIDDTVNALLLSADKKADGQLFVVGTGKTYSLIDIVEEIGKNIPGLKYEYVPYPQELLRIDFEKIYSSFNKINKILGWKPQTELISGIKKTIEYYLENLSHYE